MRAGTGWTFLPQQRGRTVRDSKSDFFESDAVEKPGQALVREAIQNALDARREDLPEGEPVRVSFRFHHGGSAAGVDLESLRPHLEAERNGLPPGLDASAPPRWLVVEDEGTVGLTGDTTLGRQPEEGRTEEHYYHFVWAEGQTNKGEGARGSHGVGKMVFSLASGARTTLLHTRRQGDGRELVIGRCHLRHHVVKDRYCDNGFFGRPDGEGFTHPLEPGDGPAFADALDAAGFRPRPPGRTGLSVAVLWPDPEITADSLREAVLEEWFESVLSGRLAVTVDGGVSGGGAVRIDAEGFEDAVAAAGGADGALGEAIALARHRRATAPTVLRKTPSTSSAAWKWHAAREEGLLADADGVRQDYLDGEPVHVRVPVTVPRRRDGGEPREGHFDVVMRRLTGDRTAGSLRPWFLREGVRVSDEKQRTKRSAAYRAIVAVDGGAVAAMLRAAENPAHTQWQRPKLKAVYAVGCLTCLEFVQSAAESLHQAFVASDEERDVFALADFFGVAGVGLRGRGQDEDAGEPAADPGETTDVDPIEPSPQPLEIEHYTENDRGGVRVRSTNRTAELVRPGTPLVVDLRVAYDVVRGSPLDRHSLADFDLRELRKAADPAAPRLGLRAARTGSEVDVRVKDPCRLRLTIDRPEKFAFSLVGFDPLRDLFAKAEVVSGLRTANDADEEPVARPPSVGGRTEAPPPVLAD